ncbi:MAG: PAS domain-containing protein, partial [Flavobacteriales bacterium]|nr:PAS domain-containing protein [Flavobacteriales bacterium]
MSYLKEELYSLIQNDHRIFDFIQNSALDGLWYWDLENGEDEWMNPKFWTTLGYDPAKMPHKAAAWKNIIHEDDLDLATERFLQHREQPEIPYDLVLRYKHFQGHIVWIRCRGMIIRDDAGKPTRMLGAHTDITSLKKKEVQLESCNAAAKIGFWEIDFTNSKMTWSQETRRIHGVEKDYAPTIENGINFYEEGWSRDKIKEVFAHSVATLSDYDVELRLVTLQGNPVWVRAIGSPVADS